MLNINNKYEQISSYIVFYAYNNNTKDINKLEQTLATKVIGQDKAIKELVNIYKKIKLGYKDES